MVDYAIRAEAVSKRFNLGAKSKTGLKERIVKRKRERPTVNEVWALRDATFDVVRGDAVGIIGHNGSGKSTALKVLAGIYRPTSGRVEVNGRVAALIELGAGFHPELTGRENIVLNGTLLGLTRREIDAATEEIIDFSGIEEFIDSPVKFYSSGMYVRLGFAIAVQVRPEILMVDEVLAVGDEEFQRKCFNYLSSLRRDGATVLLVSHSMAAIEEMCTDALWLEHGQVRAYGPAPEVISGYLGKVNSAEALAEPVADSRMLPGARRRGFGGVRITDLEIIDAEGVSVSHLEVGETARFRLHFNARETVPRIRFGIGFHAESGVLVSWPNSAASEQWDVAPGVGFVDFVVPELQLLRGRYLMTTVAMSGGTFHDHLEKAFEFDVRENGVPLAGLVRTEGQWTMVQGGPESSGANTEHAHDGEQTDGH